MTRAASGAALTDVVRLSIAAQAAQLHVAFPARVEAYDADRQTVDVQPQIERATTTIDGDVLREALPIVCAVPIAWQRSGGFGVTFPLEVGDTVLVVVCDRNIGEWRRTGEGGDPKDVGSHVLDGAVAIPGLYPKAGELGSEHVTDHLVLGSLGAGGATIHVRAGEVRLGSDSASQFVALANLVKARLDTLQAAFDAHTHSGGTLSGSTGVPAAAIGPLGDVAATKVKAA